MTRRLGIVTLPILERAMAKAVAAIHENASNVPHLMQRVDWLWQKRKGQIEAGEIDE